LKQQVLGQRKEIQIIAAEVLRADTRSEEVLSMQSVALGINSRTSGSPISSNLPVVSAGAIDGATLAAENLASNLLL
jgi:hypothetical protein